MKRPRCRRYTLTIDAERGRDGKFVVAVDAIRDGACVTSFNAIAQSEAHAFAAIDDFFRAWTAAASKR